MATTSYQYTIFDKIKFGFSMLFRCFNCFHNIYEKFQFMAFAQQSCPNTIPFLYCPYCGDKVYTLEEQPGGYNLLFTADQSVLATLTIQLQGYATKEYTIIWGDDTLSSGTFDGTLETFTHDYTTEGDYNIKIFVNDSDLLQFIAETENLKGTCPTFNQFSNITIINLKVNSLSGIIPILNQIPFLSELHLNRNLFSGNFPDISNLPNIVIINLPNNNLSGTLPSLSPLISLEKLNIGYNSFSGSLPDFTLVPTIERFLAWYNNFTGSIKSFGVASNFTFFRINSNNISGLIPSLTILTSLIRFDANSNQLDSYTASTISLTCIDFRLENNLLTQVAVDQILSDFNDNLASRPGYGIIYLHGTGNATPSAAGLVHKANIIAHGWFVITN